MEEVINQVAIVGAGPVGLYAAFNLSILGLQSVVIDSNEKAGGQCSYLYPEKNIYDIPAFEKITGQNLIDSLLNQQLKFKDKINYKYNSKIVSIEKNNELFYLKNTNNEIIVAKAIILATGAGTFEPNRIPLKNASEFEGKSLFYKIDNVEKFRNKTIAIFGGGDSATDWCFELSNIANKIYLIHRRDSFKSVQSNLDRIKDLENKNILEILTPFSLKELKGSLGFISSVLIENLENKTEKLIECDSVLAFFGLKNDNILMKNSNIETKFNLVLVDENMSTNIDGIFCIGDAANYKNKLKLIMSGFSESAIASHSIYKYIYKKNPLFQHSTSIFS